MNSWERFWQFHFIQVDRILLNFW